MTIPGLRPALAVAILAFSAGAAAAAPIAGAIRFGGIWEPAGGSAASADGIDFSADPGHLLGPQQGAFSGLATDTAITLGDFSFEVSDMSQPVWAAEGFTFTLTALSVDFQNDDFIYLSGFGLLDGPGDLDITLSEWSFQGDAGDLDGSVKTFTFVTIAPTNDESLPAPEPASSALLAAGLLIATGFMAHAPRPRSRQIGPCR